MKATEGGWHESFLMNLRVGERERGKECEHEGECEEGLLPALGTKVSLQKNKRHVGKLRNA